LIHVKHLTRSGSLQHATHVTESRQGQLISSSQVAELIGKSVRTVHRLAESGELPAVKVQGPSGVTATYVFDLAEVERWIGATAQ
jgi:excisionase family DNA binding protein